MNGPLDEILWRIKIRKGWIFLFLGLGLGVLFFFEYKSQFSTFNKMAEIWYQIIPSKNGMEKKYYKTGKLLSESNFYRGRRQGSYKEYYPDGKLKLDANFSNGKLDGTSKAYDENGRLIIKEIYKEGKITVRSVYNENP